jgi:hypothetical protein
MNRLVDLLAIALLIGAGAAFTLGVLALGDARDLAALYWLALGGLLLRGATELLRPSQASR